MSECTPPSARQAAPVHLVQTASEMPTPARDMRFIHGRLSGVWWSEEKEAAGAHGKKEFYEMCEVLSAYEGHDQGGGALRTGTDKVQEQVSQGATRPTVGADGDWKAVFFSALKTLLRETLYTRDPKQREEHLKQVHRWFKEKTDQFKRVDEAGKAGKSNAPATQNTLRGFGPIRPR